VTNSLSRACNLRYTRELINCHDCAQPVSFSAAACPHCGSTESSGPYRHNRKEARRSRVEEKNDKNLIVVMTALGAIGAFYGVETSSSSLGAILLGLCYGFVGAAIGAPLAFAINLTRNWR
jgi:predicted amidophosphoribosyltransferase